MIPNFSIVYLDTQQLDNIFTEEKVVAVRVDEKNANARLYDPILGRMLSPDPFVQAPDFTQGFNRYSYCMNNPVI
jgi:RHS repeat-associated protein